jgi:ABC-2 type transport system permease protein
MIHKASFLIFLQLLKRDLRAFISEYPGKLFDTVFLFFTNIVVFAYLMPKQGLDPTYGVFFMMGAIASFGLIGVVGRVSLLLSDIDGERTISQTLILPVSANAVFCYIAIYWAISSILLSILLFPMGKLMLWNHFDLRSVSWIRLIPMYLSANIFFGSFALWLTSVLKGMEELNTLWMRVINPLWMFGAYFYSWQASFALSPTIAYISLINPMVYIMEGMRAATFGQEGYLPYCVSLMVIWGFIFLCGAHACKSLKKRLDCV